MSLLLLTSILPHLGTILAPTLPKEILLSVLAHWVVLALATQMVMI